MFYFALKGSTEVRQELQSLQRRDLGGRSKGVSLEAMAKLWGRRVRTCVKHGLLPPSGWSIRRSMGRIGRGRRSTAEARSPSAPLPLFCFDTFLTLHHLQAKVLPCVIFLATSSRRMTHPRRRRVSIQRTGARPGPPPSRPTR